MAFNNNNTIAIINIGILPNIYNKPSKFIRVLCSFTPFASSLVYFWIHCIWPTLHLVLCDHDCLNPTGCSSYTIASVAQPNFLPFMILLSENSISSVRVCVSHPFGFITSNFTMKPVPFNNGDSPKLYLAKW